MGRKLHELGKCYDMVKEYLMKHEMYRDNDEKLLARYYYDAAAKLGMNPKSTPIFTFLEALRDGKFHSPDDITRARRKVQNDWPETQGRKWKERHSEEKVVRKAYGEDARYR